MGRLYQSLEINISLASKVHPPFFSARSDECQMLEEEVM